MLRLLLCALTAVGPFVFAQEGLKGMSLPATFRPFSADSPFNTPIAPGAPGDALSAEMIARLARAGALKADRTEWTVPLFVIDAATAPVVTVLGRDGAFHPDVDPDGRGIAHVPLPKGVWPDPEKDGHLLLVDPDAGKAWDFSRLEQHGDSWSATRVALWDLHGPGYARAFRGPRWWMGGARGSGMPLIAGLIRPEELEAGSIDHALVFACPDIRKSTYAGGEGQVCSPPASRTDGLRDGLDFLPMGARLQLDPTLDLDALGLSPTTRVIAEALQTYGMYLCDGSETFKLYFQNLGHDDTWQRLGGFDDLGRLPTERFRVLKCSLRLELKRKK